MLDPWETYAWTPGGDAITELTEAVGHPQAVRLLDTPAQRKHRLSTVEADLADDELLADWHRKRSAAA